MKKILLVDDDEGLIGPMGNYLARRGKDLEVLTASCGQEAIRILESEEVDLVLSDLCMPNGDGVELLAHLNTHRPTLPVIVMSGYVMPEDVDALYRYGHLKCLRKPMGPSEVYRAVKTCVHEPSNSIPVEHFSLTGIVQLIGIEEKTCMVAVTRDTGEDGSFFFVKGMMQRAVRGALRGEDAALEMLTWEQPTIQVKPLLHMEDAHLGPERSVAEMIEQVMGRRGTGADEQGEAAEPRVEQAVSTHGDGDAEEKTAGSTAHPAPAPAAGVRDRIREIRLSLVIASLLIVYHVVFNVSPALRAFFGNALDHPLAVFFNHALFFWIIGLLWIAYRRWSDASRREADFSAILASTGPELLMVIDAHRNVVMCSESVEQVLGYHLQEVIHKKADHLFQHASDPLMEQRVFDALRRFGFHRGEGLGKCKDGRTVQVEIITNRLKDNRGEVVLIRDITDRKEHERGLYEAKKTAEAAVREREQALAELEQSYARLKEAESLRDSLTHMVVHDMKTPLTVIESYIFLLQRQIKALGDCGDAKEHLDAALAQTRRLTLMVHSLLDASRLEAGRMKLKLEPRSMRDTIESVLHHVSTPDVTQRIRVECDLATDRFCFDPDVLQRVIANLVTNAIKYDKDGGDIVVRAGADDDWVTVAVLDRGPGIPEEGRDIIFEKFGRIDEDGRHRSGSSGLGLTFCRMAVEAHGGRIGVAPREGGGSEFWFALPHQPALRAEPAVAASAV